MTLIELMIAIVLMSILIVMGTPSFSIYIANTKVRASTESLLAGLQSARAEAIRSNSRIELALISGPAISSSVAAAPIDVSAAVANPSWIVRSFDQSTYVEGKQGNEGDSAQRVLLMASASSVVFDQFGNTGGATFTFSNPTAGACASDSPPGPIRCLNVVVSLGGRIRMCDPAVTSSQIAQGDTRGC